MDAGPLRARAGIGDRGTGAAGGLEDETDDVGCDEDVGVCLWFEAGERRRVYCNDAREA